MGIWEEYCFICAGPLRNDLVKGKYVMETEKNNHYEHLVETTITKYNWLNKLLIIGSDEKIYRTDSSHYTEHGSFIINKLPITVTPLNWHSPSNDYGIVCHADCYKSIYKLLEYKLMFANVCRLFRKYNCVLKKNYKQMEKYTGVQFFDIYRCHTRDPWLLESPTKNIKNRYRIYLFWKNLIGRFKKNPPRNSPCESATSFKPGTIKKGFDGNLWIVKKINNVKKWMIY
jgi:hypothetical protein